MAEVDTLASGDEDIDRSGDHSSVHEQRLDVSPASSAHVVLNPHEQPVISPPPAAEDGAAPGDFRG